jgi:hypothetical protein
MDWKLADSVPPGVAAVLGSLQWGGPTELALTDSEWEAALRFTDRFQLTLLVRCGAPDWVRERIARDRTRNCARTRRILDTFRSVAKAAAGCEFAVLKGFAHWELFGANPADRVQYDLDLFAPTDWAAIRDSLAPLGYAPSEGPLTLAPKSGWKWNGDFYDPAIPVSIDLHTGLWDHRMEGFRVPGLEDFWARRVRREVEGIAYCTLDAADTLAFAVLHIIRHLLHGDGRPAQVYELASFLARRSGDDAFWTLWAAQHPPELRRLQAIGFRLATEWFGCPLHAAAREELEQLPQAIRRWFEQYAASPVTAFYRPNKDEMALNLCLAEGTVAKTRIVLRRLFPVHLPKPFSYAMERGLFHLRALAPALWTMLRIRR